MLRAKNLVIEIINFLDKNLKIGSQRDLFNMIKNISLEKKNYVNQNLNKPPKLLALENALESIKYKPLLPIKKSIFLALSELKWNIDNGSFYKKNEEIGDDYLNGNMNSELIGPKNGLFRSDDFRLGLFLLEPDIFYKDHMHEAPELYVNLTNKIFWRFNFSNWIEKKSGDIIFNKPFEVHAMKVNEIPFLSIWCWPKNSSKKCKIAIFQ